MFRELLQLWPYLRRYRALYVLGAACLVLSLFLKLAIPELLGDAIDILRGVEFESEGSLASGDRGSQVRRLAIWIAVMTAVVATVRTLSRVVILGTSRRAIHDVRTRTFEQLLRLPPSFYGRTPTGALMSRCVNDVQFVQSLMGPVFMYVAETMVLYALALSKMIQIDGWLTVVALTPFPFCVGYARKQARRIQDGAREAQEKLGEISAKVDESFSGERVVKTLTLEEPEIDEFIARSGEYRRLNLNITRARATIHPMMVALAALSTALVLVLGGPRVLDGSLSLGAFTEMMLYVGMMAAPTGTLGFVISSLQRGTAALARVREVWEMEPALSDPAPGSGVDPNELPARARGDLEVRNLSVSFPPASNAPHLTGALTAEELERTEDRDVLRGVSVSIKRGTTLGVVGHTGSGKTTLLRALGRQLEVSPGCVFLDGRDVTELPLDYTRSQIGFVPQETFLFGATLAENVALGRPDAEPSAIDDAVAASQLSKDLPQLPEGMETILGERGVNLSGGQRQRTALARVMLLDRRILLLDDTLSAVDTHTADEILEELRPMMLERTTVIVAHRVSTVRHADEIIVLEEGRVVERGDHTKLLELNGRYAALHARQASDEERAAMRAALRAELEAEGEE